MAGSPTTSHNGYSADEKEKVSDVEASVQPADEAGADVIHLDDGVKRESGPFAKVG